jgi:hypothetical protein
MHVCVMSNIDWGRLLYVCVWLAIISGLHTSRSTSIAVAALLTAVLAC